MTTTFQIRVYKANRPAIETVVGLVVSEMTDYASVYVGHGKPLVRVRLAKVLSRTTS